MLWACFAPANHLFPTEITSLFQGVTPVTPPSSKIPPTPAHLSRLSLDAPARFAQSQWDPARPCLRERSIPHEIPLARHSTSQPRPMGVQTLYMHASAQPQWDCRLCPSTTLPEPTGIARPAPAQRPRLRKLRAFCAVPRAKSGPFRPICSAAALRT